MHLFLRRVLPALICPLIAAGPSVAAELKIAQSDLPAPVLEAFRAAYPQAQILAQTRETVKGQTEYELETIDGKIKRDLLYDPSGKVIEIEERGDDTAIPAAVTQACQAEFPNGKTVKAEKATRGDQVTYDLVVVEAGKRIGATFSPDGKLVKREAVVKSKKGKGHKKGTKRTGNGVGSPKTGAPR